MRKNKGLFDKLNGVYDVFCIEGLNQGSLLNLLKNRNITLFGVKKLSDKKMIIKVKISQSEKVFAITDNLCYNVKRIKRTGLFYPLYYLGKNVGIVIGCVLFVLVTAYTSNVIVDFKFTGSGKVLQGEIKRFLEKENVKKYSTFSEIDFKSLKNKLLTENDGLTFVEIYKDGNRLVVDSALKTGENLPERKPCSALYSDESGRVVEIKVYKGTALIKVGDIVNKGQLLVDGWTVIREEKISSTVHAKVMIEVTKRLRYENVCEIDDETAFLFATENENLNYGQITNKKIEKIHTENKYVYSISYSYNHVIETE